MADSLCVKKRVCCEWLVKAKPECGGDGRDDTQWKYTTNA